MYCGRMLSLSVNALTIHSLRLVFNSLFTWLRQSFIQCECVCNLSITFSSLCMSVCACVSVRVFHYRNIALLYLVFCLSILNRTLIYYIIYVYIFYAQFCRFLSFIVYRFSVSTNKYNIIKITLYILFISFTLCFLFCKYKYI